MALYPPAIQKPVPHGAEDPPIDPRVVILHIAVSNAKSLFGWFNGRSGGIESHFYIRKSGAVEQYRDTDVQADANTDANGFAISIETQGMGPGTWNTKQLAAIKALVDWCHDVHGIPKTVPQSWNGAGVGFHVQFPGRWDKRGATCPGPRRQRQYWDVLVPWMAGRGGGAQSVPYAPAPKPASKPFKPLWTPTGDMSVKQIQRVVGVTADGLYGKATKAAVKRYQRRLGGIRADGLWGARTEAAHHAHGSGGTLIVDGIEGPATIKALQRVVGVPVDGIRGRRTDRALQAWLGVPVDGIVGPQTVKALQRKVGASVDGIWGRETTKALQRYLNQVSA